jgi:hypothetical protein
MRASSSALASIAVSAVLCSTSLAGCGGGGSSSIPAATTQQAPTGGNVPISSLNVHQPAATVPVAVTGSVPAAPTSDIHDTAAGTLASAQIAKATIDDHAEHSFAGTLRGAQSHSARRSPSDVAVNSPLDLTYFGGPVLGSVVSHNIFANCNAACRTPLNFDPGKFLTDLGNDDFIELIYQYLTGPGVTTTTPLSGRYTKGAGLDATVAFGPPQPGDTNPYYGELDIILLVLAGAAQPGLGGGGDGHIYHVYLPRNVDTCFEAPLGVATSTCYSPDNGSTFAFCAYHGTFRVGVKRYLFTVEPYQDVGGCRNNVGNGRTLPNAASPTVDPADPGYSTLSHELFETITDPHLNAWFNGLTGNEIGDLCASFDNFVTVSHHPYVLQSEYSDVNHLCVSANLTGDPQTPQGGS